jgi:hypothetical protein
MDIENSEAKRYLEELHLQTQGKNDIQVSMHDVGDAIGLDKTEAGMIAEELIIEGLVELKSLAGGIGITSEGIALVTGTEGSNSLAGADDLRLGNTRVLEDQGRQAVEKILTGIRGAVAPNQISIGQLEEILVDVKTIETQLLSPSPKVAVVREVLRSLHKALTDVKLGRLAEQVNALILS